MEERIKCKWCGKQKKTFSEYEQETLTTGEYHRLCVPCANSRLRNPWNALLPMRKIKLKNLASNNKTI